MRRPRSPWTQEQAVPMANTVKSRLYDPLTPLIAVFCVLWSSAFAVAKLALLDCPPLLLVTARFLLAGVLVLAIAAMRPAPWRLGGRDTIVFGLLGLANNALYLGLNHVGMQSISAGLAALIGSANPVLTAVLAGVFLGERMTWRRASGLFLGVAGVAFIVEGRISSGSDAAAGVVLALLALVALVSGTILFKRLAPNGELWIGNGIQNLTGGLALLPFAFGFESIHAIVPTWRLLAALAYTVLLVSVLAYLLWFHLLTVLGAGTASAFHFLMPVLGLFFGWLLLDEHIAWHDLVGILPVALGIYLATRPDAAMGKNLGNGGTGFSAR